MTKLVNHPLYHKPTDIKAVLNGISSQEGNDGPDYDLMVKSADYIKELESDNKRLLEWIESLHYPIHLIRNKE